METISSKEIRDHLSEVLNQITFKHQRYTLTRSGKDMAVIISIDEWKLVEKILQKLEDEEDIQDADKAHNRYFTEGGFSLKQARKELGL